MWNENAPFNCFGATPFAISKCQQPSQYQHFQSKLSLFTVLY